MIIWNDRSQPENVALTESIGLHCSGNIEPGSQVITTWI